MATATGPEEKNAERRKRVSFRSPMENLHLSLRSARLSFSNKFASSCRQLENYCILTKLF